MPRLVPYVLVLLACTSRPPTTPPAPKRACVVGQFLSASEDDGHGVMVSLTEVHTSATGYHPSSETQFYVHDKGNPTRGLRPNAEVWLIENDPNTFPWSYLTADQARARCPARTAAP